MDSSVLHLKVTVDGLREREFWTAPGASAQTLLYSACLRPSPLHSLPTEILFPAGWLREFIRSLQLFLSMRYFLWACLYQRILLKISLPDPTDKGEQTGLASGNFSDKHQWLRTIQNRRFYSTLLAADSSSVLLSHLWCSWKGEGVFTAVDVMSVFGACQVNG